MLLPLRCFRVSFSYDIKITRQNSLLSQEEFAQVLGVFFSTVNRWETDKSKSSYKTMKLIDNYYKAKRIDFDISKKILED